MTAHPKICPETGEMMFFSYFNFEAPYLNYHRVNADGELVQSEGIDIPNVDCLLLCRPTQSSTIAIQQFGRGLRLSHKKHLLRVMDFVGKNQKNTNLEYTTMIKK